jgi:hypothetical protein
MRTNGICFADTRWGTQETLTLRCRATSRVSQRSSDGRALPCAASLCDEMFQMACELLVIVLMETRGPPLHDHRAGGGDRNESSAEEVRLIKRTWMTRSYTTFTDVTLAGAGHGARPIQRVNHVRRFCAR